MTGPFPDQNNLHIIGDAWNRSRFSVDNSGGTVIMSKSRDKKKETKLKPKKSLKEKRAEKKLKKK